jgi:hypothetical protein
MPIRIVKDRNRSAPDNYPGQGGGGGGKLPGGINSGCLTAILPLLFKNPKIALVLVAIGAAIYFLGGKNLIQSAAGGGSFSLGADLNEQVYDQAEVFEPLADNVKNPMPERVTLEKYTPEPLNQGSQGSCVAWSAAYSARTVMYAQQSGKDPDASAFSPSFLYNQIGLDGCQGSYILRAMENMKQVGALPLREFPYNENDCSAQPAQDQMQSAEAYRITGFNRLSKSGDDYKVDMLAVKQNLAQGAPVVIGMMVGGTFMQGMLGEKVWIPTADDYNKMGFGGHAMSVIGYDDFLEGGAFQIMNSWGKEWGENGFGWIRYKDFDYFVKEAYGMDPMGTTEKQDESRLQVEFGLVSYNDDVPDTRDLPTVPLKYKSGNTYTVAEPVKKGDKFKIEVTNSSACYTYIFGQETDGSSYVLFPYTPKHSPFCGITGTRLFPKDYSLQADNVGSKDYLAVVVTKKPLDYKALNESISKSRSGSYSAKVTEALGAQIRKDIDFAEKSGNVGFDTRVNPDDRIAFIIEVDKQ